VYDRVFSRYRLRDALPPWAYTNRGIAYRARGEPDRAIADYDKAIWLNPKFADAYNGRGSDADIAMAKQLNPSAGN
jgi:tetratricopeptide (TPR) repeat protein